MTAFATPYFLSRFVSICNLDILSLLGLDLLLEPVPKTIKCWDITSNGPKFEPKVVELTITGLTNRLTNDCLTD